MLCGHGRERFGHIIYFHACPITSQISQVVKVFKVTTMLVRGTQLEVEDPNHQVCTLGEERVMLC